MTTELRERIADYVQENFAGTSRRSHAIEHADAILSITSAQQPPDDPSLDCTDAAHPAWWRGQDYGFRSLHIEVNKILDNPKEPLAGVCYEPWQSLRVRLHGLVNSPPAPTREQISDCIRSHSRHADLLDALCTLFNAGSVK